MITVFDMTVAAEPTRSRRKWKEVAARLWRWLAETFGGSSDAERAQGAMTVRFEALIGRFDEVISGICYSFAKDGDEFADLRQDVLLNLWRGLRGFRNDSDEKTWVYRVAMNTCVSSYRRRSRRPSSQVSLESVGELAEASDETRERVAYLHRLIARLGSVDKSIVLLWLEERSYEEIAEVVGLKRNTVASRLHRIREKISQLHQLEQ